MQQRSSYPQWNMRATLLFALMVTAFPLYAKEVEKLRHYEPRGKYIYYSDRALAMQAARFDLPKPGMLRTVSVMLGGGKGTVRLRLFGSEGGLNAPLLEGDVIDPITITKMKSGVEKITITLPTPVAFSSSQLYVALDNISAGVTLLSDRRTKKPVCKSGGDLYYYQLLKDDRGWRWGKYAYVIELGFEFDRSAATPIFSDAAAESKLPDVTLRNQGIAWGDINGDRYLDLLAGGKLFRNNGGKDFTDITLAAGIPDDARLQGFIDVNGDARPDIFVLRREDSGSTGVLFVNDGSGRFVRKEILLPGVADPRCFSVADVDRDGRLDLFIGGDRDTLHDVSPNTLFLNRGDGRFERDTMTLQSGRQSGATIASQWVDYNSDGHLDLFTVNADGSSMSWRNDTQGKLMAQPASAVMPRSHVERIKGSGCAWADYNGDGVVDLLLPGPTIARPTTDDAAPSAIALNAGPPDYDLVDRENQLVADYLEHRSGGTAGDIDNDGLLDAVLTTSCNCSYLGLYRQTPLGGFEERTYEAGLWRVPAGPDAVWVDYDNDGRLDLSVMRDGRIVLYRNTSIEAGKNNYVELELEEAGSGRSTVGAVVTVHAGAARYSRVVTSGRGLGMQDPLRLHFGLGTATTIDSVTVRWPSSSAVESFSGITINERHLLKSGRAAGALAQEMMQLQASPNPFSEKLTITYTLSQAMHVRLDIYSATGEHITTLFDEDREGGEHSAVWEAKDRSGLRLPQGTYVYRLVTPIGEMIGKAVLRL